MSNGNSMTFEKLADIAKLLGTEAGKGRDTQIKFLMSVVEGGYFNALDLDKDKHGKDIDDATRLTKIYVEAQTGATIFDAKAPNQRKTISCVRTGIRIGMWPKGGQGEPLGTMNNLITRWKRHRANPQNVGKLDDAANVLLKWGRRLLKGDRLLDDVALLDEMCFKEVPGLRTAEQIIEEQRKALTKLYHGKASAHTALDNSPEIQQAIEALTKRLKDIAAQRKAVNDAANSIAADNLDEIPLFGAEEAA